MGVWFYKADCGFSWPDTRAIWEAPRNRPEIGYVPHGVKYAVVSRDEGREAPFTHTGSGRSV